MEKVRAFIAIHPPAEVIEQLADLISKLKRSLPDKAFRWVKVGQLHLTLQFLGYIPRDHVESYQRATEQAVRLNRAFSLKAESLGCFPTISRPRILWEGLVGQVAGVQKLKHDLDQTLLPLGYRPEERPFHPHLTVARIAGPIANRAEFKQIVEKLGTFSSSAFRVSKVDLMQSLLSPKGASYQSLGSFSLQSS